MLATPGSHNSRGLATPRSHGFAVLEAPGSCDLPSVGKLRGAFDTGESRLRGAFDTADSRLPSAFDTQKPFYCFNKKNCPNVIVTKQLCFLYDWNFLVVFLVNSPVSQANSNKSAKIWKGNVPRKFLMGIRRSSLMKKRRHKFSRDYHFKNRRLKPRCWMSKSAKK